MPVKRELATRMQRTVRKVEAEARTGNVHDPGTGQTIIKLARHQPPIRTLVDGNKIGATELAAADQIALAVNSMAPGGILRAVDLLKIEDSVNIRPDTRRDRRPHDG